MAATPLRQQAVVERITPKAARDLLAHNGHNRNLRMPRVKELSGAMRRGEWELNGETIKVARDETLLDGQHRLQAIVDSGVTISTVVVRGLPTIAQDTVDTGRRRRLADTLTLAKHPDANALAATLNVLHRHRHEQRIDFSRRTAPTPQQALALLDANPAIHQSVRVARRVTKKIGGPVGVFGALHFEFRLVDADSAGTFFECLENGAELSRSDPALHLRDHVMRPRSDRTYAQLPFHIAALTIKAFNLRRAGCGVAVLSFKTDEGFPTIDGAKAA